MERAYQNDSDWSRPFVKELAVSLGLDRIKVYKWHYDRKKFGLGSTYAVKINTSNSDV